MKIAFVVNNYPPKRGGVEMHVFSLAKRLLADGHTVTVVTLAEACTDVMEDGIRVIRLRGTRQLGGVLGFPLPGATRAIGKLISEIEPDIVSVHTRFFPLTFIGGRVARRSGIPVIHTEHGSDFVRGVSPLVALCSKLVDLTVGRYTIRKADVVLAISSASQKFIRELAGKESHIFHNAINTEVFRPSGEPVAARCNLVYLGRVVPGKGWEHVVEVAERLLPDFPELTVDFIGEGHELEPLKTRIGGSSLAGRATVHGSLSTDAIVGLLQGSLLMNPTTLSEGFQTTLLEAVAAGSSIVSTPVAAARYLESVGANIHLVAAGDIPAWTAATADVLRSEAVFPDGALLAQFDWGRRASEFVALAERVSSSNE